MKKILLYLLAILSFTCFVIACNDDDEVDDRAMTSGDFWEEMSGVYNGMMRVQVDGVPVDTIHQQAFISSDNRNKMNLKINSLIVGNDPESQMNFRNIYFYDVYFTVENKIVSFYAETVQNLGSLSNVRLTLTGTVKGAEMKLHIVASGVTIRDIIMDLEGIKLDKPFNDEAKILKVTMEDPLLVGQPEISGNVIRFYVTDTLNITDSTELWIKPEFELSEGATISERDSVKNFFDKKGVTYTVWAEDSIHRTVYYVFGYQAQIKTFDINDWRMQDGLYEPFGDWATNNGAAKALMSNQLYEGDYPVTRVKGYKVGSAAAQMKTIMRKDGMIFAGSFFQGSFDLEMKEPLMGPVYGTSFSGKPQTVKGYYKYIPGQDYYIRDSLVNNDTLRITDTCCIRAILYEAASPEITLDSLDYRNDPRVIAIAEMGVDAGLVRKSYTPFSIYFDYRRSYFTSRHYKIAMIFSSSKGADEFTGSPGSILTVSDLEVMYSNPK